MSRNGLQCRVDLCRSVRSRYARADQPPDVRSAGRRCPGRRQSAQAGERGGAKVGNSRGAARAVRVAIDLVAPRGEIEFKDVVFSYDGKQAAIHHLNFTVQAGQTIALVGTSGAGKSTALALLYRAFDPQSGSITIDGVDIRHISLASLRHNIGVVFQESLLFNRSIEENLLVGNPDATSEQLIDAATRAQAIDFIERNPQGFEARIGERGRALSGGERQRLSIARVILKNPPILILDEATSALDSSTETRLTQALEEVSKNRSTLVIAHRLATIRRADNILVMEAGQIVEAGSFDELYKRDGRFTKLVHEQFAALPERTAL